MLRKSSHVGVLCFIALLAFVVACGGGGEQSESAGRDEGWAALEAEHRALTDARAEIADLRLQLLEAQIAESAEVAAEEEAATDEGAMEEVAVAVSAEEIQAKIEQLDSELTSMAESFGTNLVDFINGDPVYQGEEPTERQKAAFRLKTSEDIILGQEYIDMGGDYRRAIEIFESALMIDPDNPDLLAVLEKAKADRFMTEERFAQVTLGMGQDQVRALLGQVSHHNVREYPEKEVLAWFFLKEEGGASGVYFQLHKKSETYQVYRVDFNAVPAAGEGNEEGDEEIPDS